MCAKKNLKRKHHTDAKNLSSKNADIKIKRSKQSGSMQLEEKLVKGNENSKTMEPIVNKGNKHKQNSHKTVKKKKSNRKAAAKNVKKGGPVSDSERKIERKEGSGQREHSSKTGKQSKHKFNKKKRHHERPLTEFGKYSQLVDMLQKSSDSKPLTYRQKHKLSKLMQKRMAKSLEKDKHSDTTEKSDGGKVKVAIASPGKKDGGKGKTAVASLGKKDGGKVKVAIASPAKTDGGKGTTAVASPGKSDGGKRKIAVVPPGKSNGGKGKIAVVPPGKNKREKGKTVVLPDKIDGEKVKAERVLPLRPEKSINWQSVQINHEEKRKASKGMKRKMLPEKIRNPKYRKVEKLSKKSTETAEQTKESEPDIWFDDVDEFLLEREGRPSGEDGVTASVENAGADETKDNPLVKPSAFKGVTKVVGMDCEMVGVGDDGTESILARVSIVNKFGEEIYDKFVKPREEVVDYRTFVSGVTPESLENAEDFDLVQKEVASILKGRILVGHAIKNDLQVLFLNHPKKNIRDTSRYKPFRKLFQGRTPSLKKLSSVVLSVPVQEGEHNSVQDAQAAVRLYTMHRQKWEAELWQTHKSKTAKSKPTATKTIKSESTPTTNTPSKPTS